MYEKIKTVNFGGYEITIYKNMSGEYFAEYRDEYRNTKILCGKDYFGIWKVLSDTLEVDETPDGDELLRIADLVEAAVEDDSTHTIIEETIQRILQEDEVLWSNSAREAVLYIVEMRYGRVKHDSNVRVKLNPLAPLEVWLMDAITSNRVYRLTTDEEYDEQPVRVTGAHLTPDNDYLLEFAILELTEDDDGIYHITTSETFMKLFSECTLSHYRVDELPAEYQESSEWD